MLKNKTAIITGGGQGIGKAIVKEFLKNGCKVFVLDMKFPPEDSYYAEVGGTADNCRLVKGDITNLEEITTTINLIASDGPINILVNNAGITKDASFKKMTAEQWQAVINVNLTGTFNMCKAVTPHLIAAGSGKIVNLASASAHGQFGQSNYSASKAGIIGLTKTLALELARYKINVNAISPGFTMTEMTSILPDNVKQKYFDTIPLGRGAEAEEIAYLVKFLSSEESNFITGNEILIDGGYKI